MRSWQYDFFSSGASGDDDDGFGVATIANTRLKHICFSAWNHGLIELIESILTQRVVLSRSLSLETIAVFEFFALVMIIYGWPGRL